MTKEEILPPEKEQIDKMVSEVKEATGWEYDNTSIIGLSFLGQEQASYYNKNVIMVYVFTNTIVDGETLISLERRKIRIKYGRNS